jgi:hypothetical protein
VKIFLWLGFSLLPLNAFGFVVADENLERLNQNVLVQSYSDKADVTVTQTFQNNSDQAIDFEAVLPTSDLASPPLFYWRSAGLTVTSLAAETAAVEVFNASKTYSQPAWLGAMDQSFTNWWQVQGLSLAPQQTAVLKYEYTLPLAFVEDVYLGQIWTADGRKTDNTTINLVRAGAPRVWTASMGTWTDEKTSEAWAKQWEFDQTALTDNLVFMASEVPNASLRFNYLNQGYEAEFKLLESSNLNRVVLVLDTSGSVFGARFERLKQALQTVFENLPEGTEFKLGFAGDTLEWTQTEWQPNTREVQRETMALIDTVQAQGKTDWEALISGLNLVANSSDDRYALVWLGDFSDIPQNLLNRLANAGWKMLMIDFSQAQSSFLERWWQRYNGQYVPLFNSGFELVEADIIKSKWQDLILTWPESNVLEPLRGDWFSPEIRTQADNNAALGQIPLADITTPLASFLPRWWAQFKIADYLRQHEGLPLNEAQIKAIISIAHTFGTTVLGLDGKASSEVLAERLNDIETNTLWDEILRLSAHPLENSLRSVNGRPFYLVEGQWEPFDWNSYVARGERPVFELWSEAHRNLFLTHYPVLAQPMSFGFETAFCAGQRCASVSEVGRAEVEATDTLLWSSLESSHWATAYWADLVWKEVLDGQNFNPDLWANPVSRGQFLVWLQRHLEPQVILPAIDEALFTDLEPTQLGAAQAIWFHQQGLFKGYADGTAQLEAPLRRIEGLKLLMQAYGLDTRDVLGNFDPMMPFTDLVGWTQPWGYEASLRGLVKGYEDNTFRPFQPLTEAEAFKLLIEAQRLLLDN